MEFLLEYGYIGLFIGTFLAATILPFSSEFLLLGLLIAGADPWTCFLWATLGNWTGGLTSYYMGYLGKWEWIEKWFRVKRETLDKQKKYIDKYGSMLAFLSWLPLVGDVFAIGLGFYKVNFTKSAIFMLIGKGVRFAVWIVLFNLYGEDFMNFAVKIFS